MNAAAWTQPCTVYVQVPTARVPGVPDLCGMDTLRGSSSRERDGARSGCPTCPVRSSPHVDPADCAQTPLRAYPPRHPGVPGSPEMLDGEAGGVPASSRATPTRPELPAGGLPRGFGDAGDHDAAATAVREVLQETGHHALEVRHLGNVVTDSSIIEGSVGVYRVTASTAGRREAPK